MQNCHIWGKTILLTLFLIGCNCLKAQDNSPNLKRIFSLLDKLKSDSTYWSQLNKRYFSRSCNDSVIFITIGVDTLKVAVKDILQKEEPVQKHNIHIKTNAIGLAAAIANAAVEIDIIPHLSITFPVYYSAWNYFKTTIKFRTFNIQPELRYWFEEDNESLFVGTHFGYGYYNVALDGKCRYQDHNRRTPAIGGGLAIGYRMPLDCNNRWNMEFSFGCGVYNLHYDKFQNTPVTKRGLKTGEVKKTYIGPDQMGISISYLLPECKKGGRK